MREELDKKLCAKYPKIFAQRNLPMTETAMCWGFPGDGWYWIIDNLCHAIQGYVDSRNEGVRIRNKAIEEGKYQVGSLNSIPEKEWQVEATQVKEKWGSLRFYTNCGDDHIWGMIWLAEVMSKNTCEMCGTTENVSSTSGGWTKNLCPKCKEERSREIKSYEKKND